MRRSILTVSAFLVCKSAGLSFVDGPWEWSPMSNGAYAAVNNYFGPLDEVAIPYYVSLQPPAGSGYEYTVTEVGWSGSYDIGQFSGVRSVIIHERVEAINSRAFAENQSLTNVTVLGVSPEYIRYSLTIAEEAFMNCVSLTTVTLPNTSVSVGSKAFSGCTALQDIPNGITDISYLAFSYCTGLSVSDIDGSHSATGFVGDINVPDSVVHIERNPFVGSWGVTNIFVGSMNANFKSIDGVLFDATATTLVAYPPGRSGNYSIPNTVKSIGSNAFEGCLELVGVTIPSSVTNISSYAFWRCTGLTNASISYGAANIGNGAFEDCSGLTNVNIPSSVGNIGSDAFAGCSSLTNISIPSSVTNIGSSAFVGCRGLTSISIPSSVTNIGDYAFAYCSGLTSVTVPSTVTSIGAGVFSYCSGLTNVIIPDSVTSIGSRAFAHCTGLTNVTIPQGVTSIGVAAFDFCQGLTSVRIPKNVTSLGGSAFTYCTKLKNVLFEGDAPALEGPNQFLGAPTTVYYLEWTEGWSGSFAGAPTQVFKPTALPSSLLSNQFRFRWTNTGTIPMNVRRATSPEGPWTVISTNNSTGQFTDTNPPVGKAFYQAYLP